jgi:hypothetical protein
MASPRKDTETCWICGADILLEECKIDEHGRAVHEQCYTARIHLKDATTPQSPNAD